MSETGSMSDPQRTCLGCRKSLSSLDLYRLQLVVGDTGNAEAVVVSSTSLGGRGSWICKADSAFGGTSESLSTAIRVAASCATVAKQKKAFARGFRRDLPADVVDAFLASYS